MPINLLADDDTNNQPVNLLADEAKPSFLDKANQYAGKFNQAVETSRLPMVAGGLLQGAGDIGASLANIPLSLVNRAAGTNLRVPHPNLGKYVDPSLASQAAFGAGQILPMLMGGASGATALGKIGGLSKIPFAGKLARPVEGAITGAAIGEDKEGDRKLGAILGAGGNIALSAKRFINKLSPKNVQQAVIDAKYAVQDKYHNLYEGLFNKANKAGLSEIPLRVPKIDFELIKDASTDKFYKSLQNFNKNPNLKNAHLAQSDMGKFVRHMEKLSKNNALTSSQNRAVEEAAKAQKKLRGSMFHAMSSSGNKSLAKEYGTTTKGYAKEVVPYNTSKLVKKYEQDANSPDIYIHEKHPEIKRSEMLNRLLGKIPIRDIALIGAGALGLNYYKKGED